MEKTTFTIGEVSEMFDLPISTIRYYDKQHLLPNLKKTNGIRSFDKDNIEAMRVIQCLKASGLEIREIQTFMELCQEGNKTFAQRKAIFEKRREVLEENTLPGTGAGHDQIQVLVLRHGPGTGR